MKTEHKMATYTKLRSGEWGIRGHGAPPVSGSTVIVEKKSGEQRTETIGRVLWSGKDSRTGEPFYLASIERGGRDDGPRRRLRSDGTYECDECGDYVEPGSKCWETGMMH